MWTERTERRRAREENKRHRSNQGRVVDQVTVYNGSDQVIHQTESDRLRNHELIERHIQELRRQNNAGLGAL